MLGLILAGVGLSSLASALAALALKLAPSPYAARGIVLWLIGSLTGRAMEHVSLGLPLMALGWLMLVSCARALDALSLGENTAASLGVDLVSVRRRIVAGAALAIGRGVAASGVVGFVSLVVPHLILPLVGQQRGASLLPSGPTNAALVLAAGITLRLMPAWLELKLGVAIGLVGTPFLIWLLLHTRGGADALCG